MSVEKENKPTKSNGFWKGVLKVLNYIFIDGLSGMAIGLFATLIIGTIIGQVGTWIPGPIGKFIASIGTFAKALMGAGIGIGMAYKLKKAPLVSISAGVAGQIGAFASNIIAGNTAIVGVGEPLGAFIAAFVALEVGSLVSGKTKVDIIVTPLVSIISGATIGLLVGPPISAFMKFIGGVINLATQQQPILMGILVSALMGIALTLPISSAAIGVTLELSGIAAGAAVCGCCCQMVGFAVMSFRENKWGGLVAQGVGTSMLQMPNIIRHPLVWLPPTITSAILGPISALIGMTSTAVGSGMGTAGLVGPFQTFTAMTAAGVNPWITLLEIAGFQIVLPAVICLAISELMRKLGAIKYGDLKLDL
ncbi:MAG: PTS sugar transporter subunit IIC [Clostridia bacterium]|nr:PTS sugar transporter subunit IIC [Clostridia bacterium]